MMLYEQPAPPEAFTTVPAAIVNVIPAGTVITTAKVYSGLVDEVATKIDAEFGAGSG